MKHSFKLLAVGLLATASSVAMAEAPAGPYIELGAGGNYPITFTNANGGDVQDYKPGLAGNITAGYSFGDPDYKGNWRAEFEFGYLQSGVNRFLNVAPPATLSGGTLRQFSYMVNGIYDFDQINWPVVPHLGFGVGASRVHQGTNGNDGLGTPITINLGGLRPSIQGIAGVEYPIPGVRGLNLGLDYRFIETFNLRESGSSSSVPGLVVSTHGNLGENELLMTLRYTFATSPAPGLPFPVATPVPAVAPAPAAEVKRAFQVFFDFNKSVITSEAGKTIQKAADTVKAGGVATINVTGHTDTVGSATYNVALSQRRAAEVKQQLVADGVSASEIATSGVGKSGLLVQTPDGVREPQNRRAEIVLQ